MAKVVIEFDTVEKTLSVTLGGAEVPDVVHAEVCRQPSWADPPEDGFCFEMVQRQEAGDDGVVRVVRTSASAGGALASEESLEPRARKGVADAVRYLGGRK